MQVVLLIVVLVFGSKKLKTLGGDLGEAIKSFKQAVGGDDKSSSDKQQP